MAHDPIAVPTRLPVHPARRKPRFAAVHIPQPDDHDGARRTVAWRRVDVRDLGCLSRGGTDRRACPSREDQGTRVAAVASHLPSRRARLDRVPRTERRRVLELSLPSRFARLPDPVERAGGVGDRGHDRAAAATRQPGRAPSRSAREAQPGRARHGAWRSHTVRRRDGPQPGRPTVHLLPFLMSSPAPQHPDDNLMERFDGAGTRKFRARDAIGAVLIAAALLILSSGPSIRKAGDEMNPGIGRELVLAVGRPAAWIADQLPLQHVAHVVTAWLSPNTNLNGPGGFTASSSLAAAGTLPPVTPDAFTPSQLGGRQPPRQPLHTMLVTGDSMSDPLDQDLAQSLTPDGIRVIQDPHIGTGISTTVLVDWGKLAAYQVRHYHPNAVVVFLGANDGYSMPGPGGQQVNCCGAE